MFGLLKYVKTYGDPIDRLDLSRCDNRRAVLLQDGNIIGYNLPRDFRIDSTIAMRYDIAHGLNLSPRNRGMLCPEFVCQLADQLSDLQDTECGSIAIDWVCTEDFGIITETLDRLLNLFAINYDMF